MSDQRAGLGAGSVAAGSPGVTLQSSEVLPALHAATAAVRVAPRSAIAHYTLGRALKADGDLEGALRHYDIAVSLSPQTAAIHTSIGVVLRLCGRLPEAIAAYRRALTIDANDRLARRNLAAALLESDQHEEAEAHCGHLLQLTPEDPDLQMLQALLWSERQQLESAIATFLRLLEIRPAVPAIQYHLAVAYSRLGRKSEATRHFELAVAGYEHAASIAALDARALINCGAALRELGRLEPGRECLELAVKRAPGSALAHVYLARVLSDLATIGANSAAETSPTPRGKLLSRSLASFDQAVQLEPANADIRFQRAAARLREGDFARGWADYESRLYSRRLKGLRVPVSGERWNGEPLPDETTLVVAAEQGLGDTIQFVRYGGLLAARGIRAELWCDRRLHALLSTCPGFAAVRYSEPLQAQAVRLPWIPLMSLPLVFETRGDTIPASCPYLRAEAPRVESWRARLGVTDRLRIGICWSGNHRADSIQGLLAARSIALEALRPLADCSRWQLVSLQRDPEEAAELAAADFGERVTSFDDLDRGPDGFLDTAALMMNLDLVISCDTAVAHLAGALGVPVWVALPQVAEWRWLTGRPDSPWYPTMRLFRQTRIGDWAEAVSSMAFELSEKGAEACRVTHGRVASSEAGHSAHGRR